MIKDAQNKMQNNDSDKNVSEEFFFPEQGITVSASSKQEADKKLEDILKANKITKSNE